jgi:hypothetical protein
LSLCQLDFDLLALGDILDIDDDVGYHLVG